MPNDIMDYATIAAKLDLFSQWLNSRHINTNNTRLSELLSNVKLIEEEHRNGLDTLKHKSLEEFSYSLIEAKSLINIYTQFHNKPRNMIPNNILKRIIEGPYLPREEISGDENVNPRNFLFELELAAFLDKGGIQVNSFDDITFNFNTKNYKVECKRVFSLNNLKYNIDRAATQLEKKLLGNQYGIIAISLEKLLGFNEIVLNTNNVESIPKESYKKCKEFIGNNKSTLDSVSSDKIIGIFLVTKFISEIHSNKHELYFCFFNTVYPLCDKLSNEYQSLNSMVTQIGV